VISGKARIAGVMGWPVSHSLSPALHNHWLTQLHIDGAYIPLSVAPEELENAFRLLPKFGFVGWNLTVPHKEAALKLVDEVDSAAKAIGAVNTVVVKDGKLIGKNTDAGGFISNLKQKIGDLTPYKKTALMLGAGGAARAVAYALKEEGFETILIANRTHARAQSLAKEFGAPMRALPWEEIPGMLPQVTLLVNTTTLGMEGQPPLALSLDNINPAALVTDIVYRPLETPLLIEARKRGCVTATGLGMLVFQAVNGFAAWFGKLPDIEDAEEYIVSQRA